MTDLIIDLKYFLNDRVTKRWIPTIELVPVHTDPTRLLDFTIIER